MKKIDISYKSHFGKELWHFCIESMSGWEEKDKHEANLMFNAIVEFIKKYQEKNDQNN